MYDKLGPSGVAGILVFLAGIGVIGWQNPIIAAGVALVVAGIGFVAYGLVKSLVKAFGMGGMM
jgi:hypothetical protein